MKKLASTIVSLVLCLSLVLGVNINANASSKQKVKLNKTKVTMYVGKTTTLKIKGTTRKVKWSTSKKSVATVSSKGRVKAKKSGKATITAKVGSKKYRCEVTVKKPYLNSKVISLNKGSTYKLKLTGAKVKSWSSSNKNVATVSKGIIKAKNIGSTIVTCRDTKGRKYKCRVNVVNNIVTLTPPKPSPNPKVSPSVTVIPLTGTPTSEPTRKPTVTPTRKPTVTESVTPTKKPTVTPTKKPTPTPAHTHNYDKYVSTTATCTTDGYITYSCSCGSTSTEVQKALEHDLVSKKVEPTEYTSGYDLLSCKRANCSHEEKSYENAYNNVKSYQPTLLQQFEYTILEKPELANYSGYILLEKYIGTNTDLVIPGVAFIGNKTYQCVIGYDGNPTNFIPTSMKSKIETIKMYDGRISNGRFLFKDLTNLTSIKFSTVSVNSEGVSFESMFENCTSLSSVSFSEVQMYNVYSLYKTFKGCTSLKNVTLLPKSSDFYGNKVFENINLGFTFSGCTSLERIELDTIIRGTSLGGTFENCTSLKEAHLNALYGDPTTLIGTFSGCSSLNYVFLENIKFSDSIRCTNMFKGCPSSVTVFIADTKAYDVIKKYESTLGVDFSRIFFL